MRNPVEDKHDILTAIETHRGAAWRAVPGRNQPVYDQVCLWPRGAASWQGQVSGHLYGSIEAETRAARIAQAVAVEERACASV